MAGYLQYNIDIIAKKTPGGFPRNDICDRPWAITICPYPRNINQVIATPATTTRLAPTNNPCIRDGSPGSDVA